jgi:hypothetical protein
MGLGVHRSGLEPAAAPAVLAELQGSLEHLVLKSDLHLLFLLVADDALNVVHPEWPRYFDLIAGDTCPVRAQVMTRVGVSVAAVQRVACGVGSPPSDRRLERFFAALLLEQLIAGHKTPWEISIRFGCPRGSLQTLLTATAAYAASLVHLLHEIKVFLCVCVCVCVCMNVWA